MDDFIEILGELNQTILAAQPLEREEALKMHSRVLESMAEGVNVSDENDIICLTNPAFDTMFGYERGELIGQPTSLLNFDPAQKKAQLAAEINQALQTKGVWFGKFKNRKKDGAPFITAARISLLEMSDKIYRISVEEDITERVQAETEKAQLFEAVSQQGEQLRALTRRLAEVQEAERKALAQELHDQIGQNLTGLSLNLNIIRDQVAAASPATELIQARLADSLALVKQVTTRIQDLMANLHPPMLDDYGLVAALKWDAGRFAERAGLTITVQGQEPAPRLADQIENALFRIAQEALNNVAKHAQANQVSITVTADDDLVRLVIADDGCGFDREGLSEPGPDHGWGLMIMTERANAVGGRCCIESSPGQGTRVVVEVRR